MRKTEVPRYQRDRVRDLVFRMLVYIENYTLLLNTLEGAPPKPNYEALRHKAVNLLKQRFQKDAIAKVARVAPQLRTGDHWKLDDISSLLDAFGLMLDYDPILPEGFTVRNYR